MWGGPASVGVVGDGAGSLGCTARFSVGRGDTGTEVFRAVLC